MGFNRPFAFSCLLGKKIDCSKMADLFAVLETLGIRKKILYPGKGTAPDYEDGTKVLDSSEIRFILKFLL